MKSVLFLFVAVLFTASVFAQNISQVKFSAGADVKVYVTPDSTAADLIAYATQDTTGVGSNNGIWYFGNNPASKKVYFTDDTTSADFKVYFTGNASNAGWINSAKSYLMN